MEQSSPIRVLIVDAYPLLREGTQTTLARSQDIEVVGSVGCGQQARSLIAAARPDVVILDTHLPGISGVELARQIRAQHPDIAILILTSHDNASSLPTLLQLGVAGYLLKTATGDDLIAAVRNVAQGRLALTQELLQRYIEQQSIQLTQRELAVLRLLALGRRNKEIASQMCISLKTVEFHVSRVLEKLGARSRTEAVRQARQCGLLN